MSVSRLEIELSPLPPNAIDDFLAGVDQRRRQREVELQQRLDAGELLCPRCEVQRLMADDSLGIDGPLLYCPDLVGCRFREP